MPTLALELLFVLVWVVVFWAAVKLTLLSASRFPSLPLTSLPCTVRLLSAPVALIVVVPPALTLLLLAVSLVALLLLWLLL
jgi:hypothetical protein